MFVQRMQEPVFQVYAFAVLQGGKIQIGAPTGRWQMIVVYRGKHDPVSRNYLVALGQVRFFRHQWMDQAPDGAPFCNFIAASGAASVAAVSAPT